MDISARASDCVDNFTKLMRLGEASPDQRSWAEDQRARLNLWADSLGVFAEQERFSVTTRLRDNVEVTRVIVQLLGGVKSSIDLSVLYVKGEGPEDDETDSEDDSIYSSSEDSDTPPQTSMLARQMRNAHDGISHLIRLSVLLRRDGAKESYSRAVRYNPLDDQGNPLLPEFESYMDVAVRRAFDFNRDETDAEPFKIAQYLRDRLQRTAISRWRRISYHMHQKQRLSKRNQKPTKPEVGPEQHDDVVSDPVAVPVGPGTGGGDSKPIEGRRDAPTGAKSIFSSATTTRQDFKPDNKAIQKVLSVGTATTKIKANMLSFPRAPSVDEDAEEFYCSFCRTLISTKDLIKKRWHEHVLHDLEPYLCVFDKCEKENKTYKTSNDWLKHMKDDHSRMQWTCQQCKTTPFDDRDTFIEHFRRHLSTDVTDGELRVAVDILGRRDTPIFERCPFCGYEPEVFSEPKKVEYQRDVTHHMSTAHLQYFALMSLPWDAAGSENEGSGLVTHASQSSGKSQEYKQVIMEDPDLDEKEPGDLGSGSKHAAKLEEIKTSFVSGETDWLTAVQKWLTKIRDETDTDSGEGEEESETSRNVTDSDTATTETSDHGLEGPAPGKWFDAIVSGNNSGLDKLIALGMDVNVKEHATGANGLHVAVLHNNRGCVRSLVDAGCDIHAQSKEHGSPLRLAVWTHRVDMVDMLVTHGADMVKDVREGEGSALHLACLLGNAGVIEQLLRLGCKVDMIAPVKLAKEEMERVPRGPTKNGQGRSSPFLTLRFAKEEIYEMPPLTFAAYFGYCDVIETLVDHGADIGYKGKWKFLEMLYYEGYVEHEGIGTSALSWAAAGNHIEAIELLLDRGAPINLVDTDDETAVMTAAAFNSFGALKLLVSRGGVIMGQNKNGTTPLQLAARKGFLQSVRWLVEQGVDVDLADMYDHTALMYAISENHPDVARYLLDYAKLINKRNHEDMTCLMLAFPSVEVNTLRVFLDRGMEINVQSKDGTSVLMMAAKQDSPACLRLLVERGAHLEDRDNNGVSALGYAIWFGKEACAEALLDLGADIEQENNERKRPLTLAAWQGHTKCVTMLWKRGAKVELGDNNGVTAAMMAAQQGHDQALRTLADYGADLGTQDDNGKTAAFRAADNNQPEILKTLLEKGAPVGQKDNLGYSPLMIATRKGRVNCVSVLLKERDSVVPVSLQDRDDSVLIAAESGTVACLRLLLEGGGYAAVEDTKGQTALMRAAGAGHTECVSVLVEGGAEPEAVDAAGQTAVFYCLHHTSNNTVGSSECLRLLLEKGAQVDATELLNETPLTLAVGQFDAKVGTDLIEILLGHGASVTHTNDKGRTPLLEACALRATGKDSNEAEKVVRLLLKAGADMTATSDLGLTPLMLAAERGNVHVVEVLLEKTTPEIRDQCQAYTGLNALAIALMKKNIGVVQALLGKGATLHEPIKMATTPETLKNYETILEDLRQDPDSVVSRLQAEVMLDIVIARQKEMADEKMRPRWEASRLAANTAMQSTPSAGSAIADATRALRRNLSETDKPGRGNDASISRRGSKDGGERRVAFSRTPTGED